MAVITHSIRLTGPLFSARGLSENIDRAISGTVAELGAIGQRLVVQGTPAGVSSGGGGLRGSIALTFRGTPRTLSAVVGSSLFYAPIVEEGRRAGRMPPFREGSPLHLWVRRKLGVTGREALRVTFLVARKIGRAGSPGAGMFFKAFVRLGSIADARFAALEVRLARIANGPS